MNILEILTLVWPLILLQLGFQVYALVDLARTKKTKNLTPVIWVLIIIFGEIAGPIAYLLVGKVQE